MEIQNLYYGIEVFTLIMEGLIFSLLFIIMKHKEIKHRRDVRVFMVKVVELFAGVGVLG